MQTGQPGELICRTPFPSMPVYFWGDAGNAKYQSSYFERFPPPSPSVWAQHDWLYFNPATKGWQILGRRYVPHQLPNSLPLAYPHLPSPCISSKTTLLL